MDAQKDLFFIKCNINLTFSHVVELQKDVVWITQFLYFNIKPAGYSTC